MKDYKVVIFDLDGTLSDSGEGITKCVQYAISKFGIEESDLTKLEHFVGPPLKEEFMKSYNFTDEQAAECVEKYRERYKPIGIYETAIYPGTEDMLKSLKENNKYIAMATSKPQPMAEEVLKFLKIDGYFDKVMGAELIGPRQSKEAVLNALFEEFPDNIKKSDCVMIGDTYFDVQGANAVGIDCIGVSYGYGDVKEMISLGAKKIVDSAKELDELLNN